MPTLRAEADQVADLTPPQENSNFRFILRDTYSKSSDRLAGRSNGRSTPQYRHLVAKSATNLGPVGLS